MNLLLVILRKIWVSRSRCFQTGNRHFQTLFELSFIFEETIFFGKLNQNIKSYVRYDLSVSRTRPGSETEQPSVTQKPSTPTNATRGRSNQQEKSTTWAFSFDRATPSFLSKRISGNQGAVRFQGFPDIGGFVMIHIVMHHTQRRARSTKRKATNDSFDIFRFTLRNHANRMDDYGSHILFQDMAGTAKLNAHVLTERLPLCEASCQTSFGACFSLKAS